MGLIKKIFFATTLLSFLLIVIISLRTISMPSAITHQKIFLPNLAIRYPQAVQHLSHALTFATISEPAFYRDQNFLAFENFLDQNYSELNSHLSKIKIGQHNILYEWQGTNLKLPAIVLMSHYDVVPTENISAWIEPPFSGAIKNNFIWGRGALDDKSDTIALLEALNYLLKTGFQPRQTIYLAIGSNEEIGGKNGGELIAKYLENKKINFVLDEGMPITTGVITAVKNPVAPLSIAEKGYVSLRLKSFAAGGHSAIPQNNNAILNISNLLLDIKQHPLKPDWNHVTNQMFLTMQPYMYFSSRIVFANLWLFKPLVEKTLAKNPATFAMINTTYAPTIIRAGVKENVLPNSAEAIINFRLALDDNIENVLTYVKKIASKYHVDVELYGDANHDPVPAANIHAQSYKLISATINKIFPDAVVVPSLMIGTTDSRYYAPLTKNIFRFHPYLANKDDLKRIHGLNERIAIPDFLKMIYFYESLISSS